MFSQSENFDFIKNISVKKDIMYEGANGVYIEYNYDFSDLKKMLKDDSLLNKSDFTFQILFKKSTGLLKAMPSFVVFKSTKGNLIYSKKFGSTLASFTKDKSFFFIPYAAIDLAEGEHSIAVDITLSGKDGNGKPYMQRSLVQDFIIHKKKQQKITFNIDYVEASKLTSNGNIWDFSPFGYNTEPDVAVSVTLGGASAWKKGVENNTVFAMGPKAKNISFMISQDDEVRLIVTDTDLMFDDYIGDIKVKPIASDTGTIHTIDKGTGKIVSCNLNWKLE